MEKLELVESTILFHYQFVIPKSFCSDAKIRKLFQSLSKGGAGGDREAAHVESHQSVL